MHLKGTEKVRVTGGNHGLAQSGDGCHGHHHQHQVDVYLVTKMSDNMENKISKNMSDDVSKMIGK